MTRRRGLIASGIAMVLLLLAMSPSDGRMKDAGGPGIVPFELNGGQHRADEIMAQWGSAGQDAARESLWIDFGFMTAYGTFLTLALGAVREMARKRDWRRMASIGSVAVYFGALGAGFDALENICLLLTLDRAGSAFPLLATVFASLKFAFVIAAIAYLSVGLATRVAIGRQSAPASQRITFVGK